ncbi:hypothetical protein BGZ65_006785, partial [Modicella reniformis]
MKQKTDMKTEIIKEGHVKDANLRSRIALTEHSSRQPGAVLAENKVRLQHAQRQARKLDGPIRNVRYQAETSKGAGEGGLRVVGGNGICQAVDGTDVGQALSESQAKRVVAKELPHCDCGESLEQEEGLSSCVQTAGKSLAEAGQLFYIGLIPGVGPVLCYYLSYRHVYVPLKDLKVGGKVQRKLRNHMMSNMFKNLAVSFLNPSGLVQLLISHTNEANFRILPIRHSKQIGLFLPVVGSFVSRYWQDNQKSVVFAAELSSEYQDLPDQPYQTYVLSLDDSRSSLHLSIESAAIVACQDRPDVESDLICATVAPVHASALPISGTEPSALGNQSVLANKSHRCVFGFDVCFARGCCGGDKSSTGLTTVKENQKLQNSPAVSSPIPCEDGDVESTLGAENNNLLNTSAQGMPAESSRNTILDAGVGPSDSRSCHASDRTSIVREDPEMSSRFSVHEVSEEVSRDDDLDLGSKDYHDLTEVSQQEHLPAE